ncbi:MAG TPA: RidA family protein [Chitinophagaceae bacterium]|nr:RidA family protein [Chitinophagaceae bacterium]
MKKYAVLYAAFMLIALTTMCNRTYAQTDSTANKNIDKQRLRRNKPLEDQVGYTQAIRTGNTIYVSGTMASGHMQDQLQEIMNRIKSDLGKYGATMQNVVKQTIYTTDLDSFMVNKIIVKSFYNGDYPASTVVEVKRLLLPQFKVSIEVEAKLPEE